MKSAPNKRRSGLGAQMRSAYGAAQRPTWGACFFVLDKATGEIVHRFSGAKVLLENGIPEYNGDHASMPLSCDFDGDKLFAVSGTMFPDNLLGTFQHDLYYALDSSESEIHNNKIYGVGDYTWFWPENMPKSEWGFPYHIFSFDEKFMPKIRRVTKIPALAGLNSYSGVACRGGNIFAISELYRKAYKIDPSTLEVTKVYDSYWSSLGTEIHFYDGNNYPDEIIHHSGNVFFATNSYWYGVFYFDYELDKWYFLALPPLGHENYRTAYVCSNDDNTIRYSIGFDTDTDQDLMWSNGLETDWVVSITGFSDQHFQYAQRWKIQLGDGKIFCNNGKTYNAATGEEVFNNREFDKDDIWCADAENNMYILSDDATKKPGEIVAKTFGGELIWSTRVSLRAEPFYPMNYIVSPEMHIKGNYLIITGRPIL